MSSTGPAIDKSRWTIVKIHDTRDVEERDDKWVRIPGSGGARACDHCSATHEVHVHVVNDAGDEQVVGGSCARGLARTSSVRKTARVAEPYLMARGPGWRLWRRPGTDDYRLTGRNADHPQVLALVEAQYGLGRF